MRAHRRIDAARPVQLVRPHHLLIQRLTHAVQALEFIAAKGEIRPGHGVNGGQRVGIVGGKLREHRIARAEQFGGAGKVRHIGVQLAREHRKIAEPINLGALDLAVPIGALYQPHHDPPAAAAGQIDQPVDHQRAALAISLHHETQAIPARKVRRQRQRFQQIERQFQPVGFLGIDVETDAISLGQRRQRHHARQQFGHHPIELRAGIARVQGRQFDRDARAVKNPAPGRRRADGVDGMFVIGEIAIRIGHGGRGFAQHVIAVGKALRFQPAGALQRFLDGLAGDELIAHHLHRHVDAAADHRFAGARDEPGEHGAQPGFGKARRQLSGHH